MPKFETGTRVEVRENWQDATNDLTYLKGERGDVLYLRTDEDGLVARVLWHDGKITSISPELLMEIE